MSLCEIFAPVQARACHCLRVRVASLMSFVVHHGLSAEFSEYLQLRYRSYAQYLSFLERAWDWFVFPALIT